MPVDTTCCRNSSMASETRDPARHSWLNSRQTYFRTWRWITDGHPHNGLLQGLWQAQPQAPDGETKVLRHKRQMQHLDQWLPHRYNPGYSCGRRTFLRGPCHIWSPTRFSPRPQPLPVLHKRHGWRTGLHSETLSDNTIVYLAVRNSDDADSLQNDLHKLGRWEKKWLMKFHPDKCQVLITRKWQPVTYNYINGHQLEHVSDAKYLGITFTNNMR